MIRRLIDSMGLDDYVALLAIAFIGAGVAMIYPPAALIVVGAILLALAIWRL